MQFNYGILGIVNRMHEWHSVAFSDDFVQHFDDSIRVWGLRKDLTLCVCILYPDREFCTWCDDLGNQWENDTHISISDRW